MFDVCLVSDWKVFGGCMYGKIYLSNHFFGVQIFVTYGKVRWVKTGRVSSCLDMSGRNILYQKVLDLNIFRIQKKFGGQKNSLIQNFLDSELF